MAAQVPRTLRALAACRTAALGGHVLQCGQCGEVTYHYHSCGNRHCPQCGGAKRAAWLAKRAAELLPVPYFHVVFTLPHQLSALVLGNRRLLDKLLFNTVAQTLLEVAADPKYLGARIGVLAVMHSWGQQLEHHPHVHCVVPGGGLAVAGASGSAAPTPRWVACRPTFLLPVQVLGRVFRGKYLAGLQQAYASGELGCAGSTAALAEASVFQDFVQQLSQRNWVVYAKEPFGGPAQMLKYLTRYTHRVAISNSRLVRLVDDQVTFTWKDYADQCQSKELTLAAVEFVRRFALHIVPAGFVRIRHYGLLTHRDRRQRLELCRTLLGATTPVAAMPTAAAAEPEATAVPAAPLPAWLKPYLLASMLLAASVPSPVVLEVVTALLAQAIQMRSLCPSCGVGKLTAIWCMGRPTGAELEEACGWDSS